MSDKQPSADTAEQAEKYTWINQTLALAVITALSYCYTYLYEKGYCSVYEIPPELIKLDTVKIIGVALGLINFVSYAFMLYEIMARPTLVKIKKVGKITLPYLRLSIFLCLLALLTWIDVTYFYIVIMLILLTFTASADIMVKAGASEHAEAGRIEPAVYGFVTKRLGRWTLNAAFYMIILGFFAYFYGMRDAKTTLTFLVPSASPNVVVVKIYGDTIITAKADLAKHEIYPVLSMYSTTSDFAKDLQSKHLFRMRVIVDNGYH